MNKLEIIYRKVTSLGAYENNSRTHSDFQVRQIAASIKQFGFTNPVLIDENGEIIAGHGRLMAADLLQMDEVPTITLVGLTLTQRRAYVIADNKLALNAGWNFEMLAVEIDGLNDLGFDISVLGFDKDEINDLIGTPNEPPEVDSDADASQDPDELQKLSFEFTADQVLTLGRAQQLGVKIGHLDPGNSARANGTALAFVCEMFITQNADKE